MFLRYKPSYQNILTVIIGALLLLIYVKAILPKIRSYSGETQALPSPASSLVKDKVENLVVREKIPLPKIVLKKKGRLQLLEKSSGYDEALNCPKVKSQVNKKSVNYVICIHPIRKDKVISAEILENGQWDASGVSQVLQALEMKPKAGLVDIGANLGVYTMAAAAIGRKVVSVEPYIENFRRLQNSAIRNKLMDHLTIVTNPVFKDRRNASLLIREGNLGMVQIDQGSDGLSLPIDHKDLSRVIETIYIDDLLPVIEFKDVVLKIDIEGVETDAFYHVSKFFDNLNVLMVAMEWKHIRHHDWNIKENILDFFKEREFTAYASIQGPILDTSSYVTWPDNILWIHIDLVDQLEKKSKQNKNP